MKLQTLCNKAERVASFLKEKGYEVLYVSLYGSQNYELDGPESDTDWKAVILPSLENIIKNRKPISTDYEFEGGLVDVKDIRLMFDCYKKQNVNFIETIFTDYRWINPTYEKEVSYLFNELNKEIAFADPIRALKCMYGMCCEKAHALCHEYPSKIDLIKRYGYDGKQLSHTIRLVYLMKSYIIAYRSLRQYKKILVPQTEMLKEHLYALKNMKITYDVPQAKKIMNDYVEQSKSILNKFIEERDKNYIVDTAAYDKLEQVKYDCMMKYFKNSLS